MPNFRYPKFLPWILIVLLGVGLYLSIYLTQVHHQVSLGLIGQSGCNFNSTFNCDEVALSPYSQIMGIPISAFGVGFYLVLILITFMGAILKKGFENHWAHWVLGFCTVGLFLDVILFVIMVTKIQTYCVNCMGTYLVNLLAWLVVFLGVQKQDQKIPFADFFRVPLKSLSFASNQAWLIWLVLLVPMGSVLAGEVYLQKKNPNPINANSGQNHSSHTSKSPGANVPDRAEMKEKIRTMLSQVTPLDKPIPVGLSPTLGNSNAAITIYEFSDLECPHCKYAAEFVKASIPNFKDRVQIVFKNFPLDAACNEKVPRSLHKNACLFARAIVCAQKQPPRDLSWELQDAIFKKGKMLNSTNLGEEAKRLGLNQDVFEKCLQDESSLKRVKEDLALGHELGVQGTPSVFINQRPLSNYQVLHPEYFPLLIEVFTEEYL